MAKTEESKLKSMEPRQLLDYYKMAGIAYDFYDNEAKANRDEKEAYANATNKMLKYLKAREEIFGEIEKRLDGIC